LFHYNIEHTNKLIDKVTWKANELWVKASLINNNASTYQEYFNDVLTFIQNVANRGISFKDE